MVHPKALSNAKVRVVRTCSTESGCQVTTASRTPGTAYSAITSCGATLWEVVTSEAFQGLITAGRLTVYGFITKWLAESKYQLPTELFVCEFSLGICVLAVQDIRVHYHNFNHPEKHLTPPADRFSGKLVVCHSLIQTVNTEHVTIVFIHHLWFHFCRSSWVSED